MATASPDLNDDTQDFLKALASETRQRLMLLSVGGAEFTVSEIAEQAQIGQSTASEQLALLRRGGLLQSRRDGKQVHYSANREGIAAQLGDLQAYLTRCCP